MVALSDCSALKAIESKFDVYSTDVLYFIWTQEGTQPVIEVKLLSPVESQVSTKLT
jgi:hypothetical protein